MKKKLERWLCIRLEYDFRNSNVCQLVYFFVMLVFIFNNIIENIVYYILVFEIQVK